tara:strand:+ start:361 stop:996 length:636 start_codon:yes stop_codon:yes gene_type:complete
MSSNRLNNRERARRRSVGRESRRNKRRFLRQIWKWLAYSVIGFVGLIIVLSLVLPASMGNSGVNLGGIDDISSKGKKTTEMPSIKLKPGDTHMDYDTYPPTSGWYIDLRPDEISWSERTDPIADELQVSYLRYGSILIQYNCEQPCPEVTDKLREITKQYEEGVILAPYNTMDAKIALTSWLWIDKFDEFDSQRIEDFIQVHLGQGPVRIN